MTPKQRRLGLLFATIFIVTIVLVACAAARAGNNSKTSTPTPTIAVPDSTITYFPTTPEPIKIAIPPQNTSVPAVKFILLAVDENGAEIGRQEIDVHVDLQLMSSWDGKSHCGACQEEQRSLNAMLEQVEWTIPGYEKNLITITNPANGSLEEVLFSYYWILENNQVQWYARFYFKSQ